MTAVDFFRKNAGNVPSLEPVVQPSNLLFY